MISVTMVETGPLDEALCPFLGLLLAWFAMLASGLLIRDSWGRVGHDDRERA